MLSYTKARRRKCSQFYAVTQRHEINNLIACFASLLLSLLHSRFMVTVTAELAGPKSVCSVLYVQAQLDFLVLLQGHSIKSYWLLIGY